MHQFTVVFVCNYAASYPGSFIATFLRLRDAVVSKGGTALWAFPKKAASQPWMNELISTCDPIEFYQRNSVIDLRRSVKKLLRLSKGKTLFHMNFLNSKQVLALRCLGADGYVFHVHSNPPRRPAPLRLIKKLAFPLKTRFLCPSRYTTGIASRELCLGGDSHCVTVPNAVDFQRLRRPAGSERKSLPSSVGFKKLLLFGWDPLTKGLDLAVRALEMLQPRGVRAKIYVPSPANNARLSDFLTRQKGLNPSLVETVPPVEYVSDYILSSDLVLVPSRVETFNFTIPETLHLGRPVLVSNIPPFQEFGIPENMVFQSGDPTSLAEKLFLLLTRPIEDEVVLRLGNEMAERFDVDLWVARILAQYELAVRFA